MTEEGTSQSARSRSLRSIVGMPAPGSSNTAGLTEQEDLAGVHPERVERLLAALETWKADVGAIR